MAMDNIGLKIYPTIPALSMTCVYHEESDKIRKVLKESYHVNIAGGQDDLKGKIFRINHMGLIDISEVSWVVNAVELTLDTLGIREFNGLANRVFIERYYKILQQD